MDFLSLGLGAASVAANTGSGLFSNRKNRKFQERQNQLNREFAINAFNMENSYNAPVNQIQRLKDAGLNPNLIYGGSSAQQASASVTAPEQPAPHYDPLNFSDISATAQQSSLLHEQRRLLKAQADKQEAETQRQIIENSYLPAILRGQLDTTNVQLKLTNENINLTKQQGLKIAEEINVLNKSCQKLDEEINVLQLNQDLLQEDILIKRLQYLSDHIELTYKEREKQLQLKYLTAQICKAYADAAGTEQVTAVSKALNTTGYISDLHEAASLHNITCSVENERLVWNFEMDQKYGDIERSIGLTDDAIGCFTKLRFGSGRPSRSKPNRSR